MRVMTSEEWQKVQGALVMAHTSFALRGKDSLKKQVAEAQEVMDAVRAGGEGKV